MAVDSEKDERQRRSGGYNNRLSLSVWAESNTIDAG